MHESGWDDPGYSDERGSHTTLRPIYADEAAEHIDQLFSRMAGTQRPTSRPADPVPSSEPAEPISLLDDLKDMGWFNS